MDCNRIQNPVIERVKSFIVNISHSLSSSQTLRASTIDKIMKDTEIHKTVINQNYTMRHSVLDTSGQ